LQQQFNKAPAASFSSQFRKELQAFFEPYNQELFAYIKEERIMGIFLKRKERWRKS